jgi:hypothetical protein
MVKKGAIFVARRNKADDRYIEIPIEIQDDCGFAVVKDFFVAVADAEKPPQQQHYTVPLRSLTTGLKTDVQQSRLLALGWQSPDGENEFPANHHRIPASAWEKHRNAWIDLFAILQIGVEDTEAAVLLPEPQDILCENCARLIKKVLA